MDGADDLAQLLASMDPVTDRVAYVFCSVPGPAWPPAVPAGVTAVATVLEDEGTTLIVARDQALAAGLDHDPGFVAARITLRVHSALDAVGLTAEVAGALAEAGISANVVAGRHHDHLFVPWDRTDSALAVLDDLGAAHRDEVA